MLKRLLAGFVMITALLGVWKHVAIADWWVLRSYDPPAAIARLATQASMNDNGRHFFYIAQPSIDDKRLFSAHCPVDELGLVLGCYSNGDIFILKVTRAKLTNVMPVTAAHEMLHAAYARLSVKQKRRINGWLDEYFQKYASSQLKKIIKAYDKSEPGQRLNELHSLVATQEKVLPNELEDYYKEYFTNRQLVVKAFTSYRDVFESLKAQQVRLEAEIKSSSAKLKKLEASLNEQQAGIKSTNQQLASYQSSNNITAYNNLVPTQNSQVQQYNNDVARFKDIVTLHNAKVEQYNQLGLRHNELVEELDASKFKKAN